ncbi:DUF4097 family beta strand repeat-containing protein [Gemmatimonas sp.]|uniref:DUF4097 family beta strand repeat-containing protein n=1 Tax=Gemmatimonas sp. TaxID=1962908 RepID=UPI00356AB49C
MSGPIDRRMVDRLARLVCATAVMLLPFSSRAQRAASDGQPVHRGYAVTRDVAMRIYVPAGHVRVVTWSRDSVDLAGTIGANASVFGGGSRTHVKLGVESRTASDSTMPRADLVISVPRAAHVWIKTIDGDIDVRGTTGELEAYAVRGRIAVYDVSGVTALESIDALVTVDRATGDLRVRGGKGDVSLVAVRGTVSVATISGAVSLSEFNGDGRVETIGGNVTFRSGSLAGMQLDIQTHAGAITLLLAAARAPALDLSSRAAPPLLPKLVQSPANGRIVARSFKGRIVVTAR